MQTLYLPQPTMEMWKLIAKDFEQIWQFPHYVGALDGKHILIKKPPNSGSSFYNYKHTFSVFLMALVDVHYKFISVDIGSMGRHSDYNQTLPFVFVADEAFPFCDNIMRPFSKRNITGNFENKIFNYRLSRARQTVECTFGILASRFRVFKKPSEIKIESVDNVIKAACVLHNNLRNEITISNNVQGESDIIPDNQLLPLGNNNSRSGSSAFLVRKKFTDYFNTEGSVPWQNDSVFRGKY